MTRVQGNVMSRLRLCVGLAIVSAVGGAACRQHGHADPGNRDVMAMKGGGANPPTVNRIDVHVEVNQAPTAKGDGPAPQPPQPPEREDPFPAPPVREAAEPERFLHYYCRCWKDEAFEKMYGALDRSVRRNMPFEVFAGRYTEDAEFNAGLADEQILGKVGDSGGAVTWEVKLKFRSRRAQPRTVRATLKKTPDGYRLMESGLVPVDLDDL